ncbi:MAG: nuclear protein [Bogoriella megaspora]|nr:MAG: nuclear protein [Bogoriella megaspora]
MARLAAIHRSSSIRFDSTEPNSRRTTNTSLPRATISPSPASDKENREDEPTPRGKGKAIMGPPNVPRQHSDNDGTRSAKRRRLGDSAPRQIQSRNDDDVRNKYDPDQPIEERQAVRKSFRDLQRDILDNRDTYLQSTSNGLITSLQKANDLYDNVKQTSDATIDSSLLVNIGDLTHKRAQRLAQGDGALGVDVDEFVSKCITFMRNGGPADEDNVTPVRRRQDPDEEENEDGDALNWEILGQRACFPNNLRPPVPGFLLGPLAVQKRVRNPAQRRARQSKKNDGPTTQPELLQKEDLQQQENSSLVILCRKIRDILIGHLQKGYELEEQVNSGEISEEEAPEVMKRLRLADNGDVSLFDFVINPHSFGQTVENIFYVSFLIREGSVRVDEDSRGLPTLGYEEPRTLDEQREKQITKHQAVFAIDHGIWQQFIDLFQIKEPLIPHRNEDHSTQPTARGWYG